MPKEMEFSAGDFHANGYTREQAKESVGLGWHGLIDLIYDRRDTLNHTPTITQVKEKFGGLRVYHSYPIDDSDEEFSQFVYNMELESYGICEVCGNSGKLRSGAWYKTLCEDHADGRPVVKPL